MLIKDVDDYLDKMQEKFPKLSKDEIKKVIQHGFLTYFALTRKGADMVTGNGRYTAYCGKRFKDLKAMGHYRLLKYRIKLRSQYRFYNEIFKGRYYFGLTDGQWEDYKKYVLAGTGRRKRKRFTFNNITLYKIKEECFLESSKRHFFMIYYPVDRGWAFKKERITTIDYEYLGYKDAKGKIVYI